VACIFQNNVPSTYYLFIEEIPLAARELLQMSERAVGVVVERELVYIIFVI
jgi:hypothetical protein